MNHGAIFRKKSEPLENMTFLRTIDLTLINSGIATIAIGSELI
jgi:hypothetical protein